MSASPNIILRINTPYNEINSVWTILGLYGASSLRIWLPLPCKDENEMIETDLPTL